MSAHEPSHDTGNGGDSHPPPAEVQPEPPEQKQRFRIPSLPANLPTLVTGVVLGILFCLVAYLSVSLSIFGNVLIGSLVVCVCLLAGALIAYWLASRAGRTMKSRSGEVVQTLSNLVSQRLGVAPVDPDRSPLDGAAIRHTIGEMIQYSLHFIALARVVAWLIALLGLTTSFAVFVAAMMQVQKIDEQNANIEAQNTTLREQNDLINVQSQSLTEQNEHLKDQNNYIEIQNNELVASRVSQRYAAAFPILAQDIKTFLRDGGHVNATSDRSNSESKTPAVRLPEDLHAQVAFLCRSLAPYRVMTIDGKLSEKALSPERGNLLVYLASNRLQLIGLDFSRADLRGADLRGADLRGASLTGANLSGADLRSAILSGADLSGADLSRADLSGADLAGLNVSWLGPRLIFLSPADLSGVDLSKTLNVTQEMIDKARGDKSTQLHESLVPPASWSEALDD